MAAFPRRAWERSLCEDTVLRSTEVVIIGAGAAGLMCALTAAGRGRQVLLLDHATSAVHEHERVVLTPELVVRRSSGA